MTSLHYERTFKHKNYTILQNGNKYLSKNKNSFFHEKRDVITLKDDVITPVYDLKNIGSDLQRQPNIFVLQALLKKLDGGGKIGPPV